MLDEARAGDFAYFDPPYAPLSATANFRGYTGRSFSDLDQQRLQHVLIELAKRKVHVLLSNSTAPYVMRLYERQSATCRRPAGDVVFSGAPRRELQGRSPRRGAELVVSNLKPRRGP